jgi:hypothetical protein
LEYTQQGDGYAATANAAFLRMVAKNPGLKWPNLATAVNVWDHWARVYRLAYVDSDAGRTAAPHPDAVDKWKAGLKRDIATPVLSAPFAMGGNVLVVAAVGLGLYWAWRS